MESKPDRIPFDADGFIALMLIVPSAGIVLVAILGAFGLLP